MNSKLSTISFAKLSNFVPVTDMQWPGFTSTSYAALETWAFHYARTDVAGLRDYHAVNFESEIDAIEHIDDDGQTAILFRRAYLWRVYRTFDELGGFTACQAFERLHSVLTRLSALDTLRYERMDEYVYARNKHARWEHICDYMCLLAEEIDAVISREVAHINKKDKPPLTSMTYFPVWWLAFLFDLVSATARKKPR